MAVFLPLVAVYSITAQWSQPYHIDALTNAVTGWYLGNEQTVVADEHEAFLEPGQHGNAAWFEQASAGPVSQYPPGAALVVAPFYAAFPVDMQVVAYQGSNRPDLAPIEVPMPPLWPATLSAVAVTSAAIAALGVVFARLSCSSTIGAASGLLVGVSSGAWAVASRMSWMHGPAMLALALGVLALSRDRWWLAGAAFGAAILCRPHLAIVPAVVGIGLAAVRRDLRPPIAIGAASALGLLSLLAYNALVWGAPSISGGYGSDFSENFVNADLGWYLENVAGALFDANHGLVTWAPFVLVLGAGALLARRTVPDWALLSLVGGVAYLLIQLRANRFSGGDGHFGYRYPLEALVVAAPALFQGYVSWARHRTSLRLATFACFAWAAMGQAMGAIGDVTVL